MRGGGFHMMGRPHDENLVGIGIIQKAIGLLSIGWLVGTHATDSKIPQQRGPDKTEAAGLHFIPFTSTLSFTTTDKTIWQSSRKRISLY
jgi:hypothetical protein